jgi:hypothetical protein
VVGYKEWSNIVVVGVQIHNSCCSWLLLFKNLSMMLIDLLYLLLDHLLEIILILRFLL